MMILFHKIHVIRLRVVHLVHAKPMAIAHLAIVKRGTLVRHQIVGQNVLPAPNAHVTNLALIKNVLIHVRVLVDIMQIVEL